MGESIKQLAQRTVRSVEREGYLSTAKKVCTYFLPQKFKKAKKRDVDKVCADVLFINGCALSHPARYRVSHQREQLLVKNVVTMDVFYTELTLDLVKKYRLFIFYRCPYTDTIGEFIELAKKYNKHVLYDIDDLVIDESYPKTVKYLQTLSQAEQDLYYEGTRLMQKTLKLCEGAITTTQVLADELKKFVPEVYINRNLASDRMMKLSEEAFEKRCEKAEDGLIRIGYFSGSITHNDDFEMILPAVVDIMKAYDNVRLCLVGEVSLPDQLKDLRDRILFSKYVEWEKLPELIAAVDINIAPLVDTVFNSAKSENKWTEAALVRVPTIASNVGAFAEMIEDGKTGVLCNNTADAWFDAMKRLIEEPKYRQEIAQNAYLFVRDNCITITKSDEFARYIKKWLTPNYFMVVPQTNVAGGVLVALKHCTVLMKRGYDVVVYNEGYEDTPEEVAFDEFKIPVINKKEIVVLGSIDNAVGTLWSTMDFVTSYNNIKNRMYLVQGYETNFIKPGDWLRIRSEQTYSPSVDVRFLTISKWCQKWLQEKYHQECRYAPNGIDTGQFYPRKRTFQGKVRILIEGNCEDFFKNVDESFQIVDQLDREKYEIWYMSYQGNPKEEYKVDRFLHKVPFNKVADVYRQCDILIKTSILESFSYPPLEMMSTGGYVVVVPNGGNVEYLVDEYNCLMYPQGEVDEGVQCVERIVNDERLRKKLYENGIETAKSRNWIFIEKDIAELYL